MKPRTVLPLTLVFASILDGCYLWPGWGGCGDSAPVEAIYDLSAEDLSALQAGTAFIWDFEVFADTPDPVNTGNSDTGLSDTGGLDTGLDGSCESVCALADGSCVAEPIDMGNGVKRYSCEVTPICVGGRMHGCIQRSGRGSGPTTEARWLAQAAHDEAASVAAFEALAEELRSHDAPSSLLGRILDAAEDEVRHAQTMTRLARARGGEVPEVVVQAFAPRTLEQIATENAVEACILETWAALRASYQATHASTEELRAVFQEIAEEETRHAELARDLQDWMESRLDAQALARVHRARDEMVARLCSGSDLSTDPQLQRSLGLPPRAESERMIAALADTLWSPQSAAA